MYAIRSYYELKKLRRGDYVPDLMLDLHGLTQQEAKLELAALLEACRRQHVRCACVMHGHGKHILKQRIPMWLAQHPLVQAFHQAPKLWGGDAALLVLVRITSYNVCYTKLLRPRIRERVWHAARNEGGVADRHREVVVAEAEPALTAHEAHRQVVFCVNV